MAHCQRGCNRDTSVLWKEDLELGRCAAVGPISRRNRIQGRQHSRCGIL